MSAQREERTRLGADEAGCTDGRIPAQAGVDDGAGQHGGDDAVDAPDAATGPSLAKSERGSGAGYRTGDLTEYHNSAMFPGGLGPRGSGSRGSGRGR